MTLATARYETRTCGDGKSALAALRSEAFDLIVTDIYMPEKDGREVIVEKRRMGLETPIIGMSSMTGMGSMLAVAKHLSARQTLQKPFSEAALLASVGAALSEHSVPPPSKAPPRQDKGFGE